MSVLIRSLAQSPEICSVNGVTSFSFLCFFALFSVHVLFIIYYTRCVAAEPAHGELWTSISKMTENRRLSKAEILKKVVAAYFADGAIAALAGGPRTGGGGAGAGAGTTAGGGT